MGAKLVRCPSLGLAMVIPRQLPTHAYDNHFTSHFDLQTKQKKTYHPLDFSNRLSPYATLAQSTICSVYLAEFPGLAASPHS
jgi:hypothetical protein